MKKGELSGKLHKIIYDECNDATYDEIMDWVTDIEKKVLDIYLTIQSMDILSAIDQLQELKDGLY